MAKTITTEDGAIHHVDDRAESEVDTIIAAIGCEITEQERQSMLLMALYDNQRIEDEYFAR